MLLISSQFSCQVNQVGLVLAQSPFLSQAGQKTQSTPTFNTDFHPPTFRRTKSKVRVNGIFSFTILYWVIETTSSNLVRYYSSLSTNL